MQVFRLMDRPDKVIAFDSLPERMLVGFEMIPANGFPRHWKEWMGKNDKHIKIPPERDVITGQARTFTPITETDYHFYVVDAMIQPVVEKWNDVCDYARLHVKDGFMLKERIEDMAKALAPDQLSPITLEPEEVVVIPIKTESEIKESPAAPLVEEVFNCDEEGCKATFGKKRALAMHVQVKHKKPVAA